MLAEWTAECSDDSPTIVVPWSDPATGLHYVDLRAQPYDIADVSEAEQFPTLGRALRSLNATRSSFLTSKCDAWLMKGDELHNLQLELDGFVSEESPRFGFASYIDILHRERPIFLSAHQWQSWLDRFTRRATRLEQPDVRLECILRPALFEQGRTVLDGYGISLYVFALSTEAPLAFRTWELALEDIVALLRGREFELTRGSATIDPA